MEQPKKEKRWDKYKETRRQWYLKNRERVLALRKEKYQNDSEYMRKYWEKNKEELNEYNKEYKKRKKAEWNFYQSKYKKIKYWEAKLEKDPDNKEIIEKLKQLKEEKYTNQIGSTGEYPPEPSQK